MGRDFLNDVCIGETEMPKAIRISPLIPASSTSSGKSNSPLVSIALFCGIGLLVSLVAILMGVPGVWD